MERTDAFLLAGFVVAGPWAPPPPQRGSLLPATVVTISDCLTDVVEPGQDAYAVRWHGDERRALAASASTENEDVRVIAVHVTVADRNAVAALINVWLSEPVRVNLASMAHPRGEARGFEVVGFEAGRFHSWLCYGLHERAIAAGIDLQLTRFGLLTSLDHARAVADMANADRDTPHGTPLDITWLPVLLAECRP